MNQHRGKLVSDTHIYPELGHPVRRSALVCNARGNNPNPKHPYPCPPLFALRFWVLGLRDILLLQLEHRFNKQWLYISRF